MHDLASFRDWPWRDFGRGMVTRERAEAEAAAAARMAEQCRLPGNGETWRVSPAFAAGGVRVTA